MTTDIKFYPGFNREVIPIVFSVEGVGFKLDVATLTLHSEFFRDMLGNPDLGLKGEGTEACPVLVPHTTKEQFANFCRWLTHKSWTNLEPKEECLVDILHVSHIFRITDGMAYAVRLLDALETPLSLCRRLHYARRYDITEWLDDAVRNLILKPAHTYNADDFAHIGNDVFVILMCTASRISHLRSSFANFHIEPRTEFQISIGPHCDHHMKCRRVWIERWFTHLSREIHSTTTHLKLSDVPEALNRIGQPGMNAACADYFMSLVSGSPQLAREEEYIQSAIDDIKALIRS